MITRSQAKKAGEHIPLKVLDTNESPVVDRESLKQMQRDDESLKKYWEKDNVVVREQEDNARQKDEAYEELKSEWNTLRDKCVQRERKQFTVPEILKRAERLVNSFMIEVPTGKICVDEAKALGAVAVGVDANFCENNIVKGELGVDPVDDVNFLEIGDYVAKESVNDVAIGVNLQSTGVT